MGNIKSFCCRDNPSTDDDQDERARIIYNQYPSTTSLYNSTNSNQDAISYGSINNVGSNSKTIEQSALDRIYQKMAANVIDVAPGESMVIQPAEFIERQKAYQARLNQIKTPLPLRFSANRVPKHISGSTIDATTRVNTSVGGGGPNWTKNNGPNSSTANITVATTTSSNSPQHMGKSQEKRRIEYEPISVDDIQLIEEISKRTVQAVKGLKIDSREQVITHFQP